MASDWRILLYGNSVILGAVGASLRQCPRLAVTTLEPSDADPQILEALRPDILLFDLEATRAEEVFSLLRSDRASVLMGISPDVNLVKVWSGRLLREISTRGLLELINSELKGLHTERLRV